MRAHGLRFASGGGLPTEQEKTILSACLATLPSLGRDFMESSSKQTIQVEGVVTQVLPGSIFEVELPDGHRLRAHLASGFRLSSLRVLPGNRVRIEVSPHNLSRGRIVRVPEDR